jgi:hypothetical protein
MRRSSLHIPAHNFFATCGSIPAPGFAARLFDILTSPPTQHAEKFPMNAAGDLEFVHRLHADGTFDSICMSCFLTIGTAESEPALVGQDKIHQCNGNGAHIHLASKNGEVTAH